MCWGKSLKILYFEPEYHGYRRVLLDGLRRYSSHRIVPLHPGTEGPDNLHLSLLTYLEKSSLKPLLSETGEGRDLPVDGIIITDVDSLIDFCTMGRKWIHSVFSAILFQDQGFHSAWSGKRKDQYEAVRFIFGLLAANRLFFLSHRQRSDCVSLIDETLDNLPSTIDKEMILANVEKKSQLLQPGLALRELDQWSHKIKYHCPTVLWNHRWEKDKNPEEFFDVIGRLAAENINFGLVLCGNTDCTEDAAEKEQMQTLFEKAREDLGHRVFYFGHCPSRSEYANLLWASDIVVSTARKHYFPASIIEAVYCNCHPVLSDIEEYRELIPSSFHDQYLYSHPDRLYETLKFLLSNPHQKEAGKVRESVSIMDWEHRIGKVDLMLAHVKSKMPGRTNETISDPVSDFVFGF